MILSHLTPERLHSVTQAIFKGGGGLSREKGGGGSSIGISWYSFVVAYLLDMRLNQVTITRNVATALFRALSVTEKPEVSCFFV